MSLTPRRDNHVPSLSTTTAAPKDSYDAFAAVDQVVSKPVLGSDGAASWQQFRQEVRHLDGHVSTAPKAPLKKADKLGTGFTSWEEERSHDVQLKQQAGVTTDNYVHFKQKDSAEEAAKRKEIKRIQQRIRPKDKEYYLKAETFQGYKFDYVFTTRDWGTGYYWDGMDSLKQLQQGGFSGQQQHEDDDDGTNDKNHAIKKKRDRKEDSSSNDAAMSKDEKKKKRKRTAPEGPVFVNDPNNPLEQVANALQRRQQQLLQQQYPFALPSPAAAVTLPAGWEAATDPTTGKLYYFCRATGERQWDVPSSVTTTTTKLASAAVAVAASIATTSSTKTAALVSPGATATPVANQGSAVATTTTGATAAAAAALPDGWNAAQDATTGKEYYFHTDGTTTWERPKAP